MARAWTSFAVWACANCLALAPSSSVAAQAVADADPATGWLEHTRARAELGVTGRSDAHSQLLLFSPVVGLDYRFARGFGVGFDWAFVIASELPERTGAQWFAGPGSPLLKVWYEPPLTDLRERWQWYAGLNVPAAWLPRDTLRRGLARNSYAFATATRGLWDAWLWVPEQMALVVGGSWRRAFTNHVRVRVDAAVAGSVSLSWLTSDLGALYAQAAPALELFAGSVYLGVRAQAVVIAPQSDPLQLAAGAYVGLQNQHWQLEASGLCNLDEPLGFIGSGLAVCGAWLRRQVSP